MSSAHRLAADAIDDERQRSSFRFCLASMRKIRSIVAKPAKQFFFGPVM
jgi:hypothetical protein